MKKDLSWEKLLERAEKRQREEAAPLEEPIWLESECSQLKRDIVDRTGDYPFRRQLEFAGSSVQIRCAYAVMSGKTTDGSALRDGWRLQTLAALFYERVALTDMQGCRSLEEVRGKNSLNAVHFWFFTHVVWGQIATGLETEARKGLELLSVCELRGQDDLPEHFAGLPRALNRLLRAEKPGATEFAAFAAAPPLQKLGEVWGDDGAFRNMLFEACNWHLKMLYPADSYHAGIMLFPEWLFALDRYRQRHTGESCLPDHPLMAYGKRILAADFSGPAHPLVAEAEAEYARRYADSPVDFGAVWRAFLACN